MLQVIKAEEVRDGEPRIWIETPQPVMHTESRRDRGCQPCGFAIVDRPAPTPAADPLATVRAALDLMLRVWPGSLGVRGYVDETGNDAAAVIDVATGETIATCDNEDRDDHATPVEDARAIVALRNAAPAIAALADECAAARDRIATLEAELAQARAHCDVQDRGNGHYQIAPSPTSPPAARPVFAGVSEDELIRLFYVVGTDGIDHGEQCPPIDISDRNGIRAVLARLEVSLVTPVAPTLVAVSDEELAEAFDKGRGVLPRDPHACLAGIRAVRDKLGAAEVTEERVKAALCEHFKYEGHRDWSADARAILAYLRATAAKGG